MVIITDISKRGKFFSTFLVSAIFSLLLTATVGPSILPMLVVVTILAGLIAVTLPTDKKRYYVPLAICLAFLPFVLLIGWEVLIR